MYKRSVIRRVLAVAALMSLALGACGDDDSDGGASAPDGNGTSDVASDTDSDAGSDAESESEDGDGDAAVDAPVGPEDAMTGEDGWVSLHDLALPDPGTAVLTIDGDEYVLDIECAGPGEREVADGEPWLFSIVAKAAFETVDGRRTTLEVSRTVIAYDSWVAPGGSGDLYEYPGQDEAWVKLTTAVELPGGASGWHTSHRSAPADHDPTGQHLPLVHVSPDGGFTVDTEVEPFDEAIHTDALAGSLQLAGQCDGRWADQPDFVSLGLS